MLKPRVVFVGAIVGLLSLAYALQLSPGLGVAAAEQTQEFVPVTDEMLLDPDPEDWLMVHRTYDFQAYSPLDQINRDNVDQLKLAWMRAMDPGPQEIRPLVYDGVMYIAHAGGDHLQALDATTGDLIWDYERTLPEDLREYATLGSRTRHLAIYGDNIFHLTADAYLVALDARTGELAWESQMTDYHDGITHSSGAMIIKGRVLSGRTCSPRSLEARCFHCGARRRHGHRALAHLHGGRRRRPWRGDVGGSAHRTPGPRVAVGGAGQLRSGAGSHLLGCRRAVTLSTHCSSWNLGCGRQHPVRALLQLDPGAGCGHGRDRLVLPAPAV